MENDMGGIFLRSIGGARARLGIGLMNLTYNLKRIETLIRLKVFDFDRVGAPGRALTAGFSSAIKLPLSRLDNAQPARYFFSPHNCSTRASRPQEVR
jgi:hypothetical protein